MTQFLVWLLENAVLSSVGLLLGKRMESISERERSKYSGIRQVQSNYETIYNATHL